MSQKCPTIIAHRHLLTRSPVTRLQSAAQRVTVGWLLSGSSEKVKSVFPLDKGVIQAIGADETGLNVRVMHVNVTGTEGPPTGVLWDYLPQNICILQSENG